MKHVSSVAWVALLTALAFLVVALLRTRCDAFDAKPAIVGGTPADVRKFPWFCSLTAEDPGTPGRWLPLCGGALIAPSLVISAAHCLPQGRADFTKLVRLRIGGTEERAISKIEYFGKQYGDVMAPFDVLLLTLDKPSTKQPIRVADRVPPSNTPATVMGTGLKSEEPTSEDYTFTTATMTYVNGGDALKLLQRETLLDSSQKQSLGAVMASPLFLTFASGKSQACGGDSGGPIVATIGGRPQLIGLVSFGTPCSGPFNLKYLFSVSVPYFMQQRNNSLRLSRQIPSCKYAGAASSTGQPKCSAQFPWYSGTKNNELMKTMYEGQFDNKGCAQTRECASAMHDWYVLSGASATPVTGPGYY